MMFRIEVVAEDRADAVNLLREAARIVRLTKEASGVDIQYCMGAYRITVDYDGETRNCMDPQSDVTSRSGMQMRLTSLTFAEACDLFEVWLHRKYPDGDYDLFDAIDEYVNECGPGRSPAWSIGIVPRRVHFRPWDSVLTDAPETTTTTPARGAEEAGTNLGG